MVGVGAKVTTHSWQNSSVCPSCPPKRGQVTRSGTVASLPVEGVGRGPSPTSMTQGPALWTGLSVQNPAGGLTQKTAPPQPLKQRPQAQEAIRTGVRVQGRESRMQRQFCPSLQKQKPPLGGGTLRNGWEWERGPVWPGQKRPSLAQGAPLGSGGGPASKGPEEVGGIRRSLQSPLFRCHIVGVTTVQHVEQSPLAAAASALGPGALSHPLPARCPGRDKDPPRRLAWAWRHSQAVLESDLAQRDMELPASQLH